MKRTAFAAVLLLASCGISPEGFAEASASDLLNRTMALPPDATDGRRVYHAYCVNCHGLSAQGDGSKAIPALAGQREPYLLYQLVQIASLDRKASEMHQVLRGPALNAPQAWRNVAAYLSRQPRHYAAQIGPGSNLRRGKSVYQKGCAMCHGGRGEGSDAEAIPSLRGQHYSYLLAQLRNFADGHRGNLDPPIFDFTAGLTVQDKEGVADYLSR